MRKIVVLGADGQVGKALIKTAPKDVTIIPLTRKELDLNYVTMHPFGSFLQVNDVSCVVNAAAFTKVDAAEEEGSAGYREAVSINTAAVATIAEACALVGVDLIHISTEMVFDGLSPTPYDTDSKVCPTSSYGRSKATGEKLLFLGNPQATCIRTSWVYSNHSPNFVQTVLNLMRAGLPVVAPEDLIGCPTSATDLANFIWEVERKPVPGLLHYTGKGEVSRYEFACTIQNLALELGLLDTPVTITPVPYREYPSSVTRPPRGVLSMDSTTIKTGVEPINWLDSLREVLKGWVW